MFAPKIILGLFVLLSKVEVPDPVAPEKANILAAVSLSLRYDWLLKFVVASYLIDEDVLDVFALLQLTETMILELPSQLKGVDNV
jgi:hypothetical protein